MRDDRTGAPEPATERPAPEPRAGHSEIGLRRRVAGLVGLVPALLVGEDPEVVHDVRVATRRIQQSLRLLAPKPRPPRLRAANRTLRRLRRMLGPWRDDDVVLETVRRRIRRSRSRLRRDAWTFVENTLTERRSRDVARARKRILKLDFPGTASTLARLGSGPGAPLPDLRAEARSAYGEWQAALAVARETHETPDVHAFRIAAKRLRYRIELAITCGERSLRPALEDLRALQKRLGEWHDDQILQRLAAEAIAHPDVLLSHPDVAATILRDLARDRERGRAIAAALLPEAEASIPRVLEDWLGSPA